MQTEPSLDSKNLRLFLKQNLILNLPELIFSASAALIRQGCIPLIY